MSWFGWFAAFCGRNFSWRHGPIGPALTGGAFYFLFRNITTPLPFLARGSDAYKQCIQQQAHTGQKPKKP